MNGFDRSEGNVGSTTGNSAHGSTTPGPRFNSEHLHFLEKKEKQMKDKTALFFSMAVIALFLVVVIAEISSIFAS